MIERKKIKPERFFTGVPVQTFEQVDERTLAWFNQASGRSEPFHRRLKAFIRGENRLGRKVGAILDVITIFLPGRFQTGREAAQIIIQNQNNAMPILKDKPWYESKTVWSAILLVLIAILQAFGLDLTANPEVMGTVYEVAYIIAGALGLVGLRDALGDKLDKAS